MEKQKNRGENMKIKEISYSRTFDLGKFRSEKIGVTAELEELDQRHIADCYMSLREQVMEEHQVTLLRMGKNG